MAHVTRTFGPLHFEDLESRRFEDLVRQLIYDFKLWRVLEATGRAGSDDGFDVRGFEIISQNEEAIDDVESDDKDESKPQIIKDRQWLIQCKREKRISPKELISYLDLIPKDQREKLHGLIFVAACEFSKKSFDAFRMWCADNAIGECYLWGKAQIEDLLYRPENDGLLFAYFGISLRIRNRSIRTALRARLAMKRKSERILGEGQDRRDPVLLRDPNDMRYPYRPDNEDELKNNPIKWKVKSFVGHHPRGLKIETRSCFAYVADDKKGWDYVSDFNVGEMAGYDNPWLDKKRYWETRDRIQAFWDKIPEKNRAWFVIETLLPYEDIYDIDEKGDYYASYPHIYLDMPKSAEGIEFLKPIRGWGQEIQPEPSSRVKYFPSTFPEVEKKEPMPVPDDE